MNACKSRSTIKGLKSTLSNVFGFSNPAVKKLLNWKQCDEDDTWAEKAIEGLVKKLKSKKFALEELERALKFNGTPSKCVTIHRSKDGRLQVSNRKILPHVISCRVWRWPDIQNHNELKPTENCEHPFSMKNKEVCINPYHYERVETNVLPPVLVPRYNFVSKQSSQVYEHAVGSDVPYNVVYSDKGFSASHMSSCSPLSDHLSYSVNIPSYYGGNAYENVYETSSTAFGGVYGNFPNSNIYQNEQKSFSTDVRPISYQEQRIWASISYYEMNTRVGDIFRCQTPSIRVDGFTNPNENSNRFCLGQLGNVKRTSRIESARRHIGKGVLLYYGGAKVQAKNISESAIFVQSRILNYQQSFHPSAVCKILPGQSAPLEIFNNLDFAQLLSQSVYKGFDAVYELRRMCSIRISFVKGWGAEYQINDITSTPCWIEIQLHGALEWLDEVLTQMRGPDSGISSVS